MVVPGGKGQHRPHQVEHQAVAQKALPVSPDGLPEIRPEESGLLPQETAGHKSKARHTGRQQHQGQGHHAPGPQVKLPGGLPSRQHQHQVSGTDVKQGHQSGRRPRGEQKEQIQRHKFGKLPPEDLEEAEKRRFRRLARVHPGARLVVLAKKAEKSQRNHSPLPVNPAWLWGGSPGRPALHGCPTAARTPG